MLSEELDSRSSKVKHLAVDLLSDPWVKGFKEACELVCRILHLKLDRILELIGDYHVQLVPLDESCEHMHLIFDLGTGLIEGVDDC